MSVTRIALCAAACVLASCSSVGRMDASPSKNIDLSGSWMLNRAASDDPKPALEKLRPKPVRYRPGDDQSDDNGAGNQQQGGGGQGGRRRQSQQQQQQIPLDARDRNENFARMQVMKRLQADLARAEQLTITQTTERFALDYGSQVRNFTPGGISVVSADWGVADQSSGWSGKQYVIEIKPQEGVASEEKFSLSSDGRQLIEELHLGGRGYPVVQLKRVYDHTDKPLPRGFPIND